VRIPFGTISVTDKAKERVHQALETKRLSSGLNVREFEKRFAQLVGTKEAVTCATGTDADVLALAVFHDFGAQRGDEVIVPALSFVATGNAVLQAGYTPVFVDIELETLNIDPGLIEATITEKTRAIMPVHLMGKPADMDRINDIARRHGLHVVEDAAEAHGATYKGRNVGTLGEMAAYSLYVAHIISTVEGGIVTTDNSDYAEVLRSLRSHGRACKCETCVLNVASAYCPKRFKYGDNADIRFIFERIGFSSKMNELEAAIGLGTLDMYQEVVEKRRRNLYYLMGEFTRFDTYLSTIRKEPHEEIGPHAFPIIVKDGAPFSRDQLVSFLEKNEVDTRSLFSSMPTQCPGFAPLGYCLGQFPNAEFAGNNGIHIGVHQDLGMDECNFVLEKIEEFLAANA
jgi:dTDP-4-amino-4,6-dideoxygalactose transaminase